MELRKPTSGEFVEKVIKRALGYPLDKQKQSAALDIYKKLDEFQSAIRDKTLTILVDPLFLKQIHPEFGKSYTWKGLSSIVSLIGIVLIFFNLELGIGAILLGIIVGLYGNSVRTKEGRQFTERLVGQVISDPNFDGMVDLTFYYMIGVVGFSSSKGHAHWPQYPSDVFSGDRVFIEE